MFLQNCWYVAGSAGEFDSGRTVARRILDKPVLLYLTGDGRPVAMEDRCPHRRVPLSAGKRIGDSIQCGYHGLVFNAEGACTHIPGQDMVPPVKVATYPVELRYGYVWIWMGAAPADADYIPELSWLARDDWAVGRGQKYIKADYRLLTDNLLDLSHEDYIHHSTIANAADENIANFPVDVRVDEARVVSIHRDMPDIASPPFFRIMRGNDDRIDRWQTAIWTAPAVNMTDVRAKDAGGAAEGSLISHVMHILTPETATSTHYFWSHSRNKRVDEQEVTRGICAAIDRTFDEDTVMLELQQKSLNEFDGPVPGMRTRFDDAPLRARKILTALIKQEQESGGIVVAQRQRMLFRDEARENVDA